MRAWLFQDHRQKKKLGTRKCPWSVGWIDLNGKRRSRSVSVSKAEADKEKDFILTELRSKRRGEVVTTKWDEFVREYLEFRNAKKGGKIRSLGADKDALDCFARLVKPATVTGINADIIMKFMVKRSAERGLKRGSTISPATINKQLRHLRSALVWAVEKGYLQEVPKIEQCEEDEKEGVPVTAEHFAAIYEHCSVAKHPQGYPFTPEEFWQAVLVFGYLTGWRIEEIFGLKWNAVDLEAGTAKVRRTKGKKDRTVALHSAIVGHLRKIQSFETLVFPWPHDPGFRYKVFHRIQKAAGIHLPCEDADSHECTERCHLYGFHALRYGFASENALKLPPLVLQQLMRHSSFATTERYIKLAQEPERGRGRETCRSVFLKTGVTALSARGVSVLLNNQKKK